LIFVINVGYGFEGTVPITEPHGRINWYIQCSVVSLNFCKEYLNAVTFETPLLLVINRIEHFDIWNSFLRLQIQELQTYKMAQFFAPLCKLQLQVSL